MDELTSKRDSVMAILIASTTLLALIPIFYSLVLLWFRGRKLSPHSNYFLNVLKRDVFTDR